MISETDILKSFQHLIKRSDADESIIIGSGDDAAVINTKDKYLVHSVDISKINSPDPTWIKEHKYFNNCIKKKLNYDLIKKDVYITEQLQKLLKKF